ncbi:hypothetical protein G6F60_015729 [Rhizopus arrhizus]|nr:hypothetical protein G6F40_017988 [Rhizopus arrhizus]KAG1367397.1 hypothetical protein G6F60_015729 [Rhizopus arrhizus]
MSADQHLVVAVEERAEGLDLAAVVIAWRVAQVPLGLNVPVGPEAILRQRLVIEAGPDRLFRHHDDGLLDALIFELVQCHKH